MNVILASNTGDFSSNDTSNFRVQLPKKLILNGPWEVALTNIQHPSSWRSRIYLEGSISFTYLYENELFDLNIIFPRENFVNVHDMIEAINLAILSKGDEIPALNHKIATFLLALKKLHTFDRKRYEEWASRSYDFHTRNQVLENPDLIPKPRTEKTVKPGTALDTAYIRYFETERKLQDSLDISLPATNIFSETMKALYNRDTDRIEFHWDMEKLLTKKEKKKKIFLKVINTIKFGKKLRSSLGFTEIQKTIVPGINVAVNSVNIIESEFFVCSSILQPQIVSNTLKPLLRIVSTTSGESSEKVKNQEFKVPYYIDLVKSEFDTIDISIVNELGDLIIFDFGKILLQLHFQRKNDAFSVYSRRS